jgi:hypothetical protein
MANAGGAWDNAKKIVEVELKEKGTPLHDATVVGDTVGDPFKDTSSVAMNPIIKFTTLFGLLAVELAVSIESQQGPDDHPRPRGGVFRRLRSSSSGARSTACASRSRRRNRGQSPFSYKVREGLTGRPLRRGGRLILGAIAGGFRGITGA